MKTKICEMLGVEFPIFAFSHCRDVVAEVTKAGGMGFLGMAYASADELDADLRWIDERVGGKPYGIDILMPNKYDKSAPLHVTEEDLPKEQVEFIRKVLDEAGIPRLPEAEAHQMIAERLAKIHMTPEQNEELIEIALKHPIKAVVNALGMPPKHIVDKLHSRDIKIGAMIGKVDHALNQKKAGVDFVVAQGAEAGGHVGTVGSMVLWSQVIDAVAPLPVLAAGGIGRGRQMAAAMAMGADGVWCGSIWLGSRESEVLPEIKQRLFRAKTEDSVRSRARTGKPGRILRSGISDAWERPDAPPTAPMPYQTLLMVEPHLRVERSKNDAFKYYPVGQIVGEMREEIACKQIIYDMMNEFIESAERMGKLISED